MCQGEKNKKIVNVSTLSQGCLKVDNFFKNMAKESIDSSEENLTSGISTDEDIDTIEFEKKLLEINCNTMEQTQPC